MGSDPNELGGGAPDEDRSKDGILPDTACKNISFTVLCGVLEQEEIESHVL